MPDFKISAKLIAIGVGAYVDAFLRILKKGKGVGEKFYFS